jgi:hypothetical protein
MHRTEPHTLAILLLILMSLALAGCAGLVTAELEPVAVAQDCTSDHDYNTFSCGVPACYQPNYGLGCDGIYGPVQANSIKTFNAPADSTIVGWSDYYDDGTQPCPCWNWNSTYSRGYVRFDLTKLVGPIDKIEYAALSWKTNRLQGGSAKACVKKLYEATGLWQQGATPATLLYDNLDTAAVSAGYVGVVEQAKHWLAKPDENFGLMLEPIRASTVAESNSSCLDALDDLRLVVKYRQKPIKWPGQ